MLNAVYRHSQQPWGFYASWDKINVTIGSQAIIDVGESNEIKITKNTSFQIPETTKAASPSETGGAV